MTEKNSTWTRSFKKTARALWDADEIKETKDRLQGIHDQLQLRLLIGVRKGVETLETQGQQANSAPELKAIMDNLIKSEATRSARHDEIVQLQKQLLSLVSASSRPSLPASTSLEPCINDSARREKAEDAILTSIWYPSIHDREADISSAHAKTFDWLFQDPKATGKPWDSFIDFLQGDTGIYWITGKPGSGKSTLVKYLQHAKKTKEHLRAWAGDKKILEASYYFFYNGKSEMQKTEQGMLLSLLRTLLEQKRDLISVAFGDRLHHLCLHPAENLGKPTLQETREAIKRLFKTSSDTAFFLTVDGLDEFDADVSATHIDSLLEIGRALAGYPNVKIVFASRPWIQFEDAFVNYPNLKMHDLTHDDIRLYVNERLEKHADMQKLLRRDTDNAAKLVRTIVESSSGVFLWVRLVVDSLIYGLRNSDSIQDLQQRLDELPTGLYDLYAAMLRRVPKSYRPQTMRLLRLILCGVEYGRELSVLGLCLAEEVTDDLVAGTAIHPMKDEDLEDYYDGMQRRLKSRCQGLVEISHTAQTWASLSDMNWRPAADVYNPENKFLNTTVVLLHRSVNDFLKQYNWGEYTDLEKQVFCPSLQLFRSAILLLRTYRSSPGKGNWPILLKLASYAAQKAQEPQDPHVDQTATLLKLLDSTMSSHLAKMRALPKDHLDIPEIFDEDPGPESHWTAWYEVIKCRPPILRRSPQDPQPNLVTFAVIHGLTNYLQRQVTMDGSTSLQKPGLSVLGYAMCQSPPWNTGCAWYPRNIEFLLSKGFKPTEMYNDASIWSLMLRLSEDSVCLEGNSSMPAWAMYHELPIMTMLLRAGANPHERITWPAQLRPGEPWHRSDVEVSLLRAGRRILTVLEALQGGETSWAGSIERRIVAAKDFVSLLEKLGATDKEWKGGVLVWPPSLQEAAACHNPNEIDRCEDMPAELGIPDPQPILPVPRASSESEASEESLETIRHDDSSEGVTETPRTSTSSDRWVQNNVDTNRQESRASKRRKSLMSRLREFGKKLASAWKRWAGYWRRN